MADPRIQRTHDHVLSVVRGMLAEQDGEPLTFSRLAERAQVSRRTLYVHWGTIERLLGDAAAPSLDVSPDDWEDSGRARLRRFIVSLRDSIAEPVANAAVSSLLSLATHDVAASETLVDLAENRIGQFRTLVAPISDEQYAELVGPVYFLQFIARRTMTDSFLETTVDRGAEMLGLTDEAVSTKETVGQSS